MGMEGVYALGISTHVTQAVAPSFLSMLGSLFLENALSVVAKSFLILRLREQSQRDAVLSMVLSEPMALASVFPQHLGP